MTTIIDTFWVREDQIEDVAKRLGAKRPVRSMLAKAPAGLYLESAGGDPEIIKTADGTYRMSRYNLVDRK
jgi:hypothetical protein